MWGSGPSDVWAVSRPYWDTSDAEILHYDGSAWSIAATFPASELYAVGGRSANDVWAVGTKGLTVHFDGNTWTQIASSTTNDLNGVWVSAAGTAWAVGTGAQFGTSSTIIRFTGSSWVTMPSPDNQRGDYEHVWGASDGDVWLAGQAQIDKTQPAIDPSGYVIHWNGTGWDAPLVLDPFSTPLHAVFGSSASHVCAVGSASAVETWNGSSWTPSALPGNFESIWESSPSDTWAVGMGGVMAHFDGKSWTELTPPPPDYGIDDTVAIWSNGPNDAWIAANGDVSANLLHWDGHAWNASSISAASPSWIYFHALWGTSASNMWAVGSGPTAQTGRIVHFDGAKWSVILDQEKIYDFLGVWGASENDVWFSGGDGALFHWDGSTMTSFDQNTQDQLFSVGGSSSSDVWLAGSTNEDLHDAPLERFVMVDGVHGQRLHHQHLRAIRERNVGRRLGRQRRSLRRIGMVAADAPARSRIDLGKQPERHLGRWIFRVGRPLRRRGMVVRSDHRIERRGRQRIGRTRRVDGHERRRDPPSPVIE